MRDRVGLIVAVAVSLTVLAACDGQVDGSPAAFPRGQQRSLTSGSTARGGGLGAFCDAVNRGAHEIEQSHGDLHVVLRSFDRMNAVAPAAIRPDTSYVVNAIRHAFATHQTPNLTILGKHTRAVAQWSGAHCLGA